MLLQSGMENINIQYSPAWKKKWPKKQNTTVIVLSALDWVNFSEDIHLVPSKRERFLFLINCEVVSVKVVCY